MRRADDMKHARQLRKDLVKQLDSPEGRTEIDTQRITFAKVAERYEEVRLIPAQYVGDRKIAGLRSVRSPKISIKRLIKHFGAARICSITHSQIDEYRLKRLSEKLKIASVNRELALLRSIFNFAKQECIIARTPFEMGRSLISVADEVKRDRVLSRDEEARLLLAFSDGSLVHLRPLIIGAIDTGCRRNELLSLRWSDVDIEGGVISLRAFNTKTARARQVPISGRLKDELQRIRNEDQDASVFSARNLRRSWDAACKAAGIEGLRLHDCRHTFASRLAHSGMSISELAALLGHSQIQIIG
jgi:integrase